MRMRGKARLSFALFWACLLMVSAVFVDNPGAFGVTLIVAAVAGLVIRFSLNCPHCGRTLGQGSPDRLYYLTSDRCASCGKEY
jgi:hypothetical protein